MTKIAVTRAVAMAITGTAISTGSALAGTTSYNTFNHDRAVPMALVSGTNTASDGGTDGWMRTLATFTYGLPAAPTPVACQVDGSYCGDGIGTGNVLGSAVPWSGNDPRTDPDFNFVGTQTLNWTAVLNSTSDSLTISNLDSFSRYGIHADLDTALGAWHDGLDASSVGHGGKYDLDMGLFKSDVTQTVVLNISSLGPDSPDAHYGFTIFEGQDISTAGYNHHGYWHNVSNATALAVGDNAYPITPNNPFGRPGLTRILDDVEGNSALFTAQAGQVYTIWLGGFQDGNVYTSLNDYSLTVSSVPVPAAIWLFGSAVAGVGAFSRRKEAKTRCGIISATRETLPVLTFPNQ